MGARRADWVNKTSRLIRRDIPYFQVIFTIPDKLSSLVLGNRKPLYRQLFHSAASALRRSLRDECGRQSAAVMMLHTWNQRLEHHPHVHALVPGAGPSLDGESWCPCRYTQATDKKPAKPFLVDNVELGDRFRDSYLRGVKALLRSGKLKVKDASAVEQLLEQLRTIDWVVFIQAPPTDLSDPANVLKYLARYMTGGPISDRRIIEVKAGRVYFMARSKDKSGRQIRESLPLLEFIRRWTLHILPKGFTKARCFGGWSNKHREAYQERCDRLQPAVEPVAEVAATEPSDEPAAQDVEREIQCPRCEQAMIRQSSTPRPSWADLFYGPDHPQWLEMVHF